MIFTNKTLETYRNDQGKPFVETCSLYGKHIDIILDARLADYVTEFREGYHKNLTMRVTAKDKALMITNRNTDGIFLVLDTLDYKFFNTDGKIYTADPSMIEEVVTSDTISNRAGNCKWDLKTLKAKEGEFVLIKLVMTSGLTRYITITDKGFIKSQSPRKIDEFLAKEKPEIKLDKVEWTEV